MVTTIQGLEKITIDLHTEIVGGKLDSVSGRIADYTQEMPIKGHIVKTAGSGQYHYHWGYAPPGVMIEVTTQTVPRGDWDHQFAAATCKITLSGYDRESLDEEVAKFRERFIK